MNDKPSNIIPIPPKPPEPPEPPKDNSNVNLPATLRSLGGHVQMLAGHLENLSLLLYDNRDGAQPIGNPGDVEMGTDILIDAIAKNLAGVATDLKELSELATERGYH